MVKNIFPPFSKSRLLLWIFFLFIPTTLLLISPPQAVQVEAKPQSDSFVYLPTIFNNSEKRILSCNPSGGSGGLSPGTHDTVIAGRPATVIVGEGYDNQQPTFLAFYLHGDEGGYDYHTHPSNLINQFINDSSWIYVAPQAPLVEDGYHRWNWPGVASDHVEENAKLVSNVLEHMFANYNLCQNILFGSGASAGSVFLEHYFVPTRGGIYPAFINLNCGSAGFQNSSFWIKNGLYPMAQALAQDPEIMRRTELHFTVGTEDFIYDDTLKSIATYENLGFEVNSEIIEGAGHCAYGTDAKIAEYWAFRRRTLSVPDLSSP